MGKWKTVVDFGEDGADIDDVIKALEPPNPKDPQADIREAIADLMIEHYANHHISFNRKEVLVSADQILTLFQAHQQELLSELLEGTKTPEEAGIRLQSKWAKGKLGELNGDI